MQPAVHSIACSSGSTTGSRDSLAVLVSALQQFSTLGIDFISYTQNIDTTTPMGRLFYHVIG
jgi:DNA invertase Pin-like site-specific DNA recombinase